MRPFVLAALSLGALLVSTSAPASPARDLFTEVERLLRFYQGPSRVDREALTRDARVNLDARCAPRADTCSVEVARDVVRDLVKAFGDKHTNYRDPNAARRARAEMHGEDILRIGVRLVPLPDKTATIGFVRPGSPAEEAGLEVGTHVRSINGLEATALNLGAAEEGGSVVLALADHEVRLTSRRLPARDYPTLRTVDGVNVINIPTFLTDGTARAFFETLRDLDPARPLIVDVRANGGGSLDECMLAASAFGAVTHELSGFNRSTRYRAEFGRLFVNNRLTQRLGSVSAPPANRVAVLVSERTASCGEIFALNLQRLGAKVVGQRTAGVMNSAVGLYDLSDGSMLSVTTSTALGKGGSLLEAWVTPDEEVPLATGSLRGGRDVTLDAALGALRGVAAN